MTDIVMVQPHEVVSVWPRVRPLIQKAIDTETAPHYSAEDVLVELVSARQQLWLRPFDAVLVTQIQNYPQARSCMMTFCGGEDMDEWFADAQTKITAWAEIMGCTEMLLVGRRGWERIFPEAERIGVTLRKPILKKDH